MAPRARTRSGRSSHPPLWLVEGLDIVHRKVVPFGVTVAVVVVGATLLAWLAPGVLAPTPLVGAAVGLAALLLGTAAAVTTDASDLTVRGPRHVAAAGGELVAVLPREPSVAAAGPLATAIIEVREPGSPLLLAFATASRDARRTNAWTQAIARALVNEGVGVLRADLASGRSDDPGLVEVVRDGRRLAEVVSFEPGVKLAELSAGRDHAEALVALTELPARLPRDLDILLVALPTATSRAVVAAATALDHVLVVAERDRTSRVDLIASLEALSAAGTQAQVVLLDTPTAMRLAPPVMADPDDGSARRRGISSIVGTAPVVERGSDGDPVPVAEDEHADDEVSSDEDDLAASDDPPGAGEDEVPAQGEEEFPTRTEEELPARTEEEDLERAEEELPARTEEEDLERAEEELPARTEEEDLEHGEGELPARTEEEDLEHGEGELPARTEEEVAADVEDPIDRPAWGAEPGAAEVEQPGSAEVEQPRVVDGDALALAEAAGSEPDARQDVPAEEAVDAEQAAGDEAADEEATDPDGDVDPRDTAVLDAAAAATGLAIADAQQGLTGELAAPVAEPRSDRPDHAGDHDPALPAEGDDDTAHDRSVEPSTEPAEQPLPHLHEGPPAEGVVQLDLGAEVRPGAAEDDATDELPRLVSRRDAAGGPSREPGRAFEHTEAIAQPTPPAPSDPFEATDEDLLHTTARLAIITEDVLAREATDDDVAEEGDRATQDLDRGAHDQDPARQGDPDPGTGRNADDGDDRAAGEPDPGTGRDTGA